MEDSTQWKKFRINAEHHLNPAFEANDIIDLKCNRVFQQYLLTLYF